MSIESKEWESFLEEIKEQSPAAALLTSSITKKLVEIIGGLPKTALVEPVIFLVWESLTKVVEVKINFDGNVEWYGRDKSNGACFAGPLRCYELELVRELMVLDSRGAVW